MIRVACILGSPLDQRTPSGTPAPDSIFTPAGYKGASKDHKTSCLGARGPKRITPSVPVTVVCLHLRFRFFDPPRASVLTSQASLPGVGAASPRMDSTTAT